MEKDVRDGRINLIESVKDLDTGKNKISKQKLGLKGCKKVAGIIKGHKHLFSPALLEHIDGTGQKGDKRLKAFQLPDLSLENTEDFNKTVQGLKGARMITKNYGKGGGFKMNKTALNMKQVDMHENTNLGISARVETEHPMEF